VLRGELSELGTRVLDRKELIGATLRQVQFFSKWPAETLAAPISSAQLWRYAKGQAVYEAAEPEHCPNRCRAPAQWPSRRADGEFPGAELSLN
jgi:hypothetical protein